MAVTSPPNRTLRYRLRRLLADNPVVLKEPGRMRGARAFIVRRFTWAARRVQLADLMCRLESATHVSGQVNVGEIGAPCLAAW